LSFTVSVFSPTKKATPEEFKRVTEVTYLDCVYGTLSALRRMLPRDHVVIVEIGSALAYRGIPLQAAYCGAKHALQGFVDLLRRELLQDESHVRVIMVQCRHSTRRSFLGLKAGCRESPSRCRRSFSRKSPPKRRLGSSS
jgi:NADP-dependent 3-hydroxy acid dehydrogenase YdfG